MSRSPAPRDRPPPKLAGRRRSWLPGPRATAPAGGSVRIFNPSAPARRNGSGLPAAVIQIGNSRCTGHGIVRSCTASPRALTAWKAEARPRSTRPPDRKSTTDHSSTIRTGWCRGTTTLPERIRTVRVIAASAAAITDGFGGRPAFVAGEVAEAKGQRTVQGVGGVDLHAMASVGLRGRYAGLRCISMARPTRRLDPDLAAACPARPTSGGGRQHA